MMETTEDGLNNDDGMHAPLLAHEGDDDNEYRVQSTTQTRMKTFSDFDYDEDCLLDGFPTRYVCEFDGFNLFVLFFCRL